MGILAQLLTKYAIGHRLEANGKTYEFGVLTYPQVDAIQKGLYRVDRDRLRSYYEDGELSADEYRDALKELRDRDAAGHYDLLLRGRVASLNTQEGQIVFLAILLGIGKEEAFDLLRARTIEVVELINVVICESFEDVKKRALEAERAADAKEAEGEQRPVPTSA